MAIVNQVILGSINVGGYKRPSDWLPLPAVANNEQKIVGLAAVFEHDINMVSIACTTSAGQYRVDWGDGVVENFNSNVVAYHYYSYSTLNANTLSTRNYRQAIFSVTVVNVGATFTGSARFYNSQYNTNYKCNNILDLHAEGGFNQFYFAINSNNTSRCFLLEQFETHCSLTNCEFMFYQCFSFQNMKNTYVTKNCSSFQYMFSNCALFNQPISFATAAASNFTGFLYYATSYNVDINLNIAAATSMTQAFAFMRSFNKSITLSATSNNCKFNALLTDTGMVSKITLNLEKQTNGGYVLSGSVAASMNYLLREVNVRLSTNYGLPYLGYYFNYHNASIFRLSNMNSVTTAINLSYSVMNRTNAMIFVNNDLYDRTGIAAGIFTITGSKFSSQLTADDLAAIAAKNWSVVN